jgi:sugar lactone lactonase YvrE
MRGFAITTVAAIAVIVSACNGNNQALPPPAPLYPNLYVTTCSGTHFVDVYDPPFSAATTPSIMVPFPSGSICTSAVQVLPNNLLVVGTFGAGWYIYQLPLTNSSAPIGHVATPANVGGFAVDSSGNLIVSDHGGNKIDVFPPPFLSTSVFSVQFASGSFPYTLGLDSPGKLFVGNCGSHTVTVYTPPFTNVTTATATISPPAAGCPEGLGVDASGNLYVGDFTTNTVNFYTPPYTNASSPTTTIVGGPAGTSEPASFAFDRAGHVYIENYGANTITAFTPPLSSASVPLFTMPTESAPFGMSFGP